MIRLMVMQIHRSDGYREHCALLTANVFTSQHSHLVSIFSSQCELVWRIMMLWCLSSVTDAVLQCFQGEAWGDCRTGRNQKS